MKLNSSNYIQISLRRFINIILWVVLVACFSSYAPLYAQTNTEIFGQNRVQYRKFKWRFFETKHFKVYHYDRTGIPLARFVAEQAENDIPLVEHKLEGAFSSKLNIILYNNYDDYRQTNVGQKFETQQQQDISAGKFDLVGDNLLIYFDGNHTNLRRQIQLGMVRLMMQKIIFGTSTRSVARNALTPSLPKWATEGYVYYMVDGWNPQTESEWKNILNARPTAGFYELGNLYPEVAGKAFWKYVSDQYGENSIPQILRVFNENANINKGTIEALGLKVTAVYDSCMQYYKQTFTKDFMTQETPDTAKSLINIKLYNDGTVIRNMRIAPRGRDIAYCEYKEGEYKIYIQHTAKEQQRSLILETGRKDYNDLTPDDNYPLMAWSNNGYKVAILYRYKRQTRIRVYNSLKAKIENYIVPPNRFDRVLSMCFNETDDKLIFSAIRKSQTDLYYFTFRRSVMENITNDIWDDLQPCNISGGGRRGILFLSNRPQNNFVVPAGINELPNGPLNIFFFDTKTESPVLLQCTDNKQGRNISQPIQYGDYNFAYLMDSNGVNNKYVVIFARNKQNRDSAISVPVTNYSSSILNHQYNPASSQVFDVLQVGEEYRVFMGPLLVPGENAEPKTLQQTTLSATQNTVVKQKVNLFDTSSLSDIASNTPTPPKPIHTESPTPKTNIFRTEFDDSTASNRPSTPIEAPQQQITESQEIVSTQQDTAKILDVTIKDSTYVQLKSQIYRLIFKPDFLSARLDNTVLFTKYQPAGYNGNEFSNPPLGSMITASLNDVLENHRFTGGLRLPLSLTGGMTWFLQYQNFTGRADWGLLFIRNTQRQAYTVRYTDSTGRNYLDNEQIGKVTTNMLQGNVSLPIDRVRRIGMQLGLRQDVLNFLASDSLSLVYSTPQRTSWLTSRVEYVFDNSRSPILNIRYGFRYKFFGEYFYGLSKTNKGGLYNLGVDFRYYTPIYKNVIFAARVAGAHSAGTYKILYLAGGVDNQMYGAAAENSNANPAENYVFQTQATNLRGYGQNARSGNTYAVGNFELRAPVLETIFNRPIRSSVLRSIQLVGFVDAGSAWDGLWPDTKGKTFTSMNNGGTVIATVNLTQGLAMGYGAGLRASLFGYFMRLDAAWNIEQNNKKQPVWYFSLGTDF